MFNTSIAQFYMHNCGKIQTNILYPNDNIIKILCPNDNSFRNKKIYYDQSDIETFEAYFDAVDFNKSSFLVEATLNKYRKGVSLSCKSLIFKLNTNDIEVEYMMDSDSKELTITVWERDDRNKFLECFKALSLGQEVYVGTSEAQCSAGIRVAKVECVELRLCE